MWPLQIWSDPFSCSSSPVVVLLPVVFLSVVSYFCCPILSNLNPRQRKRHYWRLDCKCIILFQNNTSNKYYKVRIADCRSMLMNCTLSVPHQCIHVTPGDPPLWDSGGASCYWLHSSPTRHQSSLLWAHHRHYVLLCRGRPQYPSFTVHQQPPDTPLPKYGAAQQWHWAGGGKLLGVRHSPGAHASHLSGCPAGWGAYATQ